MILKRSIIACIKFYQRWISPGLPSTCRFYPSCSHYALQAIDKYGLSKGILMALGRILRCNPFNQGGYDPLH